MALTPRIDRLERNFIINGAMDFWQRNAGSTTTINTASSASGYTTDRFLYFSEGTTVKNYSIARTTSVPTYSQSGFQFQYSRRWQCLTAITSPSASDYIYHTNYRMEGIDYQSLHGAKTIGFGFWIRTNVSGDHAVFLCNGAYTRAYATSFNIAVSELNSWVYKTVTVATDTAGTWVFDNTKAFEIGFGAIGSTNRAAPSTNQWYTVTGVNLGWFSGAANLMGTIGNYVELTGLSVQLGAAAASTQFTRAGRNLPNELALCQRYYEQPDPYDFATSVGQQMQTSAVSITNQKQGGAMIAYKVTKRTVPSVVYTYGGVVNVANWDQYGTSNVTLTTGVGTNTIYGHRPFSTATNSLPATFVTFGWYADAEL